MDLVINRIPIIADTLKAQEGVFNFKLVEGHSAETSGGLLCVLPADSYKDYIKELEETYGQKSWHVGEVVKGTGKAQIHGDVEVEEVSELLLS